MRNLTLILFFSLFAATAFAQTTIGVRAAYGQSNVRSAASLDLVTDQMDALGVVSYGVFAEIPLTPVISFRPGLDYTKRGTQVSLTEDVTLAGIPLPVGAQAETRFSYIDAPLLFQFNLPTESGFQPYAIAGPSIGYATGGKVTTSARAIIELDLFSTDINLDAIDYNRTHVALVGGLGAKARLGQNAAFFVEARYEHGLSQPYDVPLVQDKVGFQNWNLGAGVSFGIN